MKENCEFIVIENRLNFVNYAYKNLLKKILFQHHIGTR